MNYMEPPFLGRPRSKLLTQDKALAQQLSFLEFFNQLKKMQQSLTITTWIISLCAHNFLWYESNWFRRLEGLLQQQLGSKELTNLENQAIFNEVVGIAKFVHNCDNSLEQESIDSETSQDKQSHVTKQQPIEAAIPYQGSKRYEQIVQDFKSLSPSLHLNRDDPEYPRAKNKQTISANPKLVHYPTCGDQYFKSVTESNRACALGYKEPCTSEIQFQRLSELIT